MAVRQDRVPISRARNNAIRETVHARIRKLLMLPELSMVDIAERTGVSARTVGTVNRESQIRKRGD